MLPLSGRKVWMGGNTLPTERHIRLVPMTSGKRLYACLPGHAGLAAHRGCLEAHSRSDPLHDCWRVCGWAIRSVRSVPCCSRCQGMTASGPAGLAMAEETGRVLRIREAAALLKVHPRSEEHTLTPVTNAHLVCRLLLE